MYEISTATLLYR